MSSTTKKTAPDAKTAAKKSATKKAATPTAAASSTYDPALKVSTIKPHPANPRRSAVADEEMVASLKGIGLLQPIVVAPTTEGDGYVVIAGHRRLDGLKKARKTTTPAIIRTDLTTDAQQIEAAVVENVHRVDLSAMEEAEAFEQLRNLKHTQADIARITGRPVSTIRDRLKLLKLSKKTQQSLHEGQLTIGDALDIVAFDDDTKAQTALVKAAADGNLRGELMKQKRLRENRIRTEQSVDRLTKEGVKEYPLQGARDIWEAQRKDDELSRVGGFDEFTYDEAKKKHDGCLGYVVSKEWDGGQAVTLVCTASSTHAAKLTKAEKDRQQAEAERQAMWKAEREQKAVAKKLRLQTVIDLVPEGAMIPDFLVDQLRVVLPAAPDWLYGEMGDEPELYFETAGLAEADRFRFGLWDNEEDAKHLAFVAAMGDMPGWRLVRLLMVILLELTDNQAHDDTIGATITTRFFGFLEQLGHPFSEQDNEIRDRAMATLAPDDEVDPYDLVHTKGHKLDEPGTETPCGLRATTGKTLTTNPEQDNVTCPTCHEHLEEAV